MMTNKQRVQSFYSAQQQAQRFLASLQSASKDPQTFTHIAQDIRQWRHGATKVSFAHKLSFFNSSAFINKLSREKTLKPYLKDSIAYLFIRDLDLDISQKSVSQRIDSLTDDIASRISGKTPSTEQMDPMLLAYRWSKNHQGESAFIWLSARVYRLKQTLPDSMSEHQGIRKLLKVVAGVLLNAWQNQGDDADFDQAIRLGYYYGLTYPLIDDLQDSQVLTPQQKQSFDFALEQSILLGTVSYPSDESPWLQYVFGELSEGFHYIKQQQGDHFETFLDQAYIFFKSQQQVPECETDDSVWLAMINKSSRSRILADSLISNEIKLGNYQYFGLFNQLHDDLKDVELDYKDSNLTPYVALIYQNKLYNGVHPYQVYWALLHHLIYQCYHYNPQIKALLIKRCINSHKSLYETLGKTKFEQRMQQLTWGTDALGELHTVVMKTVTLPLEMAWFDKYLSQQVQANVQSPTGEQALAERIEGIQAKVSRSLTLANPDGSPVNELERAANYSLSGSGKYFRSVLCTLYAQDCLNLTFSDIEPVVRFIEYMHTASLIFDDKPSQDNSALRRGQPTLHRQLGSEAQAEVAAINLMMKAVETHADIRHFKAQNVLASLTHASQLTQKICQGQWLDLAAKGKTLSINELEQISLKKTAYAIESALVLPALLAGKPDQHIHQLKQYAKHLGIAFQIKDDLLDIEADQQTLGKPALLDTQNQSATYVRCLGRQGAVEQLYRHYYGALDSLNSIDHSQALAQMATWVVHRRR